MSPVALILVIILVLFLIGGIGPHFGAPWASTAFATWRDDVWAAVIASLDAGAHPPTAELPQPTIPTV